MAFRDEREALRARAERAEEQLAEANRALAALREGPRSTPPDAPPSDAPAPAAAAPEPPGERPRWGRRAAIATGVVAVGGVFVLYLDASLDHRAEVTWHAVVKTGSGAVAAGTPCTVRGRFRSNGTSRVAVRVDVRCGDTVLYPGDREFGGLVAFSPRRCGVWEGAAPGGKPGVYHYRLDCSDPGKLALDTARGELVAMSASGARVEMQVDTYSEPRPGSPLYDGNSPASGASFTAFERTGKVRTTSRPDQVPESAACLVRVEPAFSRSHNCRLEVRCGDRTLYGAKDTGFTKCDMEDGRPVRAHDKQGSAAEGDPIVHMDLPAGKVEASDDVPGAPDVTITLDPAEKAAP